MRWLKSHRAANKTKITRKGSFSRLYLQMYTYIDSDPQPVLLGALPGFLAQLAAGWHIPTSSKSHVGQEKGKHALTQPAAFWSSHTTLSPFQNPNQKFSLKGWHSTWQGSKFIKFNSENIKT